MRIRSLRVLAVLLTFFFANIACSKDLTRKEAERLILAAKSYPEVLKTRVAVPTGTFWNCKPKEVLDDPAVKRAVAEGLLTIKVTGKRKQTTSCADYTRDEIVAELTPAGEAMVASRFTRRLDINPDEVNFRACEIEFAGITGITFGEERSVAEVEYQERYARVTPWAEDDTSNKCSPGKTLTRRARFRKYDDGWRLRQ